MSALNKPTITPRLAPGIHLYYIAPEQTGRLHRTVDYRTDLYSLGCVFYEMLTGRVPFDATDMLEVIHSHIAKTPAPPKNLNPNLSDAVNEIIMKLLSKNAEDRYQSAEGLLWDLEHCLKQFNKDGFITPFILAQHDASQFFQIPQKLYGRESEINTLLSSFNEVQNGHFSLTFVRGYSGVGKTALVREMQSLTAEKRGYFVSGKCDQYHRNRPYAPLILAFTDLVNQLLTEPEAHLKKWKTKLTTALAPNVRIIADVIPLLDHIMGPQEPVTELDPTEAQNRFIRVFQAFIRVFTSADHPLVIFLDDLQWADAATIDFLYLVMKDEAWHHIMLLGTYRENEVSLTHPLSLALEKLRKEKAPIQDIHLDPLPLQSVTDLVSDSLKCTPVYAKDLAKLIHEKTLGNAFFLHQLFLSLYEKQMITLDETSRAWAWDMATISKVGVTDNVLDLMLQKVNKIPDQTQQMLQLAACVGNTFSPTLLAHVQQTSSQDILTTLKDALDEGLVIPVDPSFASHTAVSVLSTKGKGQNGSLFKFIHDQVQKTVHEHISKSQREKYHYQIGQTLLHAIPSKKQEAVIFELVDHLNYGSTLITKQVDKKNLAQLNLKAGKKAKSSQAYKPALDYLDRSASLYGKNIWKNAPTTARDCFSLLAECEYLTNQFDKAEHTFDIVLDHTPDEFKKVDVYSKKIVQYTQLSRHHEAIEQGIKALKILGISIPFKPSQGRLILEVMKTRWLLWKNRKKDLATLPRLKEPRLKAIIAMLSSISPPANLANVDLFALIQLIISQYSLRYGNTEFSPMAYACYGIILGSGLHNYKAAYDLGKDAVKLSKHFGHPAFIAKTELLVMGYLYFWRDPINNPYKPILEIRHDLLNVGDVLWGNYALTFDSLHLFLGGTPLATVVQKVGDYRNWSKQVFHEEQWFTQTSIYQASLCLQGKTASTTDWSTDSFDDAELLKGVIDCPAKTAESAYYLFKCQLHYIFNQDRKAFEMGQKCMVFIKKDVGKGNFHSPDCYLYSALAAISQLPTLPFRARRAAIKDIKKALSLFERWTKNCPDNFSHRYHLLNAQWQLYRNKKEAAYESFKNAIDCGVKYDYFPIAALACERLAQHHQAHGQNKIAAVYFLDAKKYYKRWGATQKVLDLGEQDALTQIIPSKDADTLSSTEELSKQLDVTAVLKASQAISGEIELNKLLSTLMTTILELAGAQPGFLILKKGGEWTIQTTKTLETGQPTDWEPVPLSQSEEVAVSIVRYVIRTEKAILLDNASEDHTFQSDPYIISQKPKSLLCAPIRGHGELVGVLYLENNTTTGSFSTEQLEMVRLLSAQAAISLENANLYSEMEDKVKERTKDLHQMNEDLKDFSHIVSHDLKAPLRSITTTAKWINEDYSEQLDTQGKESLQDLMVGTQRMRQLIDGVLRYSKAGYNHEENEAVEVGLLVQDVIKALSPAPSVHIELETPFPTLTFEPTKLQQIFQNLIGNAVKYMDKPEVQIRVGCTETEQHWQFYIADNGPGIAKKDFDRIFKLFQSTTSKKTVDSSGVGLSIVKKIIERHDGRIWLESEVGKGTIFYFTVPK